MTTMDAAAYARWHDAYKRWYDHRLGGNYLRAALWAWIADRRAQRL